MGDDSRPLTRLFGLELPSRLSPAAIALVLANLVPLWGVFALGWDVFTLLMLFWTENVIIGILNVVRMAVCPNPGREEGSRARIIPFFIVHYGMFTAGHGAALIGVGDTLLQTDVSFETLSRTLAIPALALAARHGLSFVLNFLHRGEYRNATRTELMHRPYYRVIVLHLTIIFGAFLAGLTGQHWAALAFLIVVKILVDLHAHHAERKKLAAATPNVSLP